VITEINGAVLFRLLIGQGYTRIARELRLPRREIRKLQRAHGLVADMDRGKAVGDERGFRAALHAQPPQYVQVLARRYGISKDRALRIAHEELRCARFKRGVGKRYEPLQSADDLPSAIDIEADRRIAGERT
jgi:hypothetical protein